MINYSMCSVRFICLFWRFLGDQPEAVEPMQVLDFFIAVYAGLVRNAGCKTAIEAAALLHNGDVIDTWAFMREARHKYKSFLHWDQWSDDRIFNQIITEAMRYIEVDT